MSGGDQLSDESKSRSSARMRLRVPPPKTPSKPPARVAGRVLGGFKRDWKAKDEVGIARLSVRVAWSAALLSAVTTVAVTLINSVDHRIQSADEFRRTQQQATYSEFLAAASALDQAEVELWAAAPNITERSLAKELDAVADASANLSLKLAMVRLTAPPDTAYQAVEVLNVLTRQGIIAGRASDKTEPLSDEEEDAYRKVGEEYFDCTEKFIASARDDLG